MRAQNELVCYMTAMAASAVGRPIGAVGASRAADTASAEAADATAGRARSSCRALALVSLARARAAKHLALLARRLVHVRQLVKPPPVGGVGGAGCERLER